VPGPDHHFLINPYGLMFDEITASSLVKVDLDGKIVMESPYHINPAGFTIHSAVHAARDDAMCVMHLHTDDGVAVSAQADGLLPLSQMAMLVYCDVAYHDYEGIALDLEERESLVRDLGNSNVMILRNHGTLAVGRNCAEAFLRMYSMERACTMQVRAMTGRLNQVNQGVPEKVYGQSGVACEAGARLAWPAMLRMLDRTDPSWRS
jgi:ribulose-5-phosphate 4-epimerase/fuculose-1-phosphate aldolase